MGACCSEQCIQGVQFIAGVGVSLFIICSGYGLEESYKRKGLHNFWKKKLPNVIIPYYLICLTGYFIWNYDNIALIDLIRILDFESQWYINYIMINYTIFFLITYSIKNYKKREFMLVLIYLLWFLVDTMFFASVDAPFLRARQMFAFLSGIVISNNKEHSKKMVESILFIGVSLIVGICFMALTNTTLIKSSPIIISNTLSLFTVIPLAYAVVGLTLRTKMLFINQFLVFTGLISYEIFLVHSNCLYFSYSQPWLLVVFFILVFGVSYLFNIIYKQVKERIS